MYKTTQNLRTNCVQPVRIAGQKPADKRTQVIPPAARNGSFTDNTADNSRFCTPTHTFFTATFPQAKMTKRPKLFPEFSLFSPEPTIMTTIYI